MVLFTCRRKILLLLFFVFSYFNIYSQSLSAAATISNYSIAQKNLLIVSTAKFINFITQNNRDRDSVMLTACKVTGLPFLCTYIDDDSGSLSEGADLCYKVRNRVKFNGKCSIYRIEMNGLNKTTYPLRFIEVGLPRLQQFCNALN